jgi:hypothetical protein
MSDVLEKTGPWHDPIIAEVRAVRRALFAASGNDIREFCRRVREEQMTSGHVIVTRAAKVREEPTGAEHSS